MLEKSFDLTVPIREAPACGRRDHQKAMTLQLPDRISLASPNQERMREDQPASASLKATISVALSLAANCSSVMLSRIEAIASRTLLIDLRT